MEFFTPNDRPAGSSFRVADNEGALCIFWVHSIETDVPTAYGESDAAKVRVAVLDGPNEGSDEDNVLIFQKALLGMFTAFVGGAVVGRIGTQPSSKPGQSPAWILLQPDETDMKTAEAYVTKQVKAGTSAAPSSSDKGAPSASELLRQRMAAKKG